MSPTAGPPIAEPPAAGPPIAEPPAAGAAALAATVAGSERFPGKRIRRAVRALVLAPDPALLLVRFEFPSTTVWAAPGGGIEPGETPLDALRRELREETGLDDAELGPEVWHRTHLIPFLDGSHDGQHDRYFLVPVPARFDPRPSIGWDRMRAEHVAAVEWWTPDDLTAAAPTTRFAPRALPRHLADLLHAGPPSAPVDVGE